MTTYQNKDKMTEFFLITCIMLLNILCLFLYLRTNGHGRMIIQLLEKQAQLRVTLDTCMLRIDDRFNELEHNYKLFISDEKFKSEDLREKE